MMMRMTFGLPLDSKCTLDRDETLFLQQTTSLAFKELMQGPTRVDVE